jgi:hypothetical protein
MFVHFNMATLQDREWGDPTSPPDLFHPTALDTDQWAAAAQSANMTWGCLTTRHHDGFCMWPTKTGATVMAHLKWSHMGRRPLPSSCLLLGGLTSDEEEKSHTGLGYCEWASCDRFFLGLDSLLDR